MLKSEHWRDGPTTLRGRLETVQGNFRVVPCVGAWKSTARGSEKTEISGDPLFLDKQRAGQTAANSCYKS